MLQRIAFCLAVFIGLAVHAQTPFPPVTDFTLQNGGFGPTDVTRNTGDSELGNDKVAVFRPAAAKYGEGGLMHPFMVWGNGSTNTVDMFKAFLTQVATYGFVVVAPEQTQVTANHMNDAIDYILRLARDPASDDYGKIDTTKIGSSGCSLGGMGAITVGSNSRIGTTFFFVSTGRVENLKAPWGMIEGENDEHFDWNTVKQGVIESKQPAFGAALAGLTHNPVGWHAKSHEAYIGWMRWRFMGDKAGHDMFVGPDCQISSDDAFAEVVKSANFDSLTQVHPHTSDRAPSIKNYVIVPDAKSQGILISFTDQIRPSNIKFFDLQGKLLDNILPHNSNSVLWKTNSRGCYIISLRIGKEQYLERVMVY